LRIGLDTYPAFFILGAKILSAYPPTTQKEVRICREKFSHSEEFQNFIAQKYEKPNSGDKFGHIKINSDFNLLNIFKKISALSVYGEYAKRRNRQ
jgi:hypothetical protein